MGRTITAVAVVAALVSLPGAGFAQTRPVLPELVGGAGGNVGGGGGANMVGRLPLPEVNNAILTELAAQIVIVHNVPGVGIAVIDRTGVRALGVAGVRRSGEPERLQPEDKFHIGSCGKAITATLLARLAERGKLSFSDPVIKFSPPSADFKPDSGFGAVTLTDLLYHRSGLPSGELEMQQLPFLRANPDPVAARARLAERVLGKPPVTPVGEFHYSNVGYALAGHAAEVVTGKSFADLLDEEVFRPLNITTAGFGAPAFPGKTDQPYGHAAGMAPVPTGPFADNPQGLAPAGTLHLSLRDWGKFLAVHLGGGPEGFLKKETVDLLHTPPSAATGTDGNPTYAMGWGVTQTRGRPTLTHAGSNTMWFAQVMLFPEETASATGPGWGIIVATNIGDANGQKAALEVLKELVALSK